MQDLHLLPQVLCDYHPIAASNDQKLESEVEINVSPPGTLVVATSKSGRSYSYENFAAGVGSITKIEVLDAPDLADSLAHNAHWLG